jgi:hypothetical protein
VVDGNSLAEPLRQARRLDDGLAQSVHRHDNERIRQS